MQKKSYNIIDSANMFLMALIIPNIVAFFVATIFAVNMGADNFLNSKIYMILSMLLNQVVFLIIFLIYNFITKSRFALTKISNKINFKQVLKIVLIAIICFVLITPLMNVFDAFLTSVGVKESGLNIKIDSFAKFIFLFFSLAVFAPIMEEIIFRGVIFNGLTSKNKMFAVLMSSLLFMLIHLNLHQSIYQFIMGIVLSLSVLYTNSLISSILIHFINNATILIINYIMPNLSINYLSLTYIIIAIVLFVCGVIGLFFCFKWLKKDQKEGEDKTSIELIKESEFQNNEETKMQNNEEIQNNLNKKNNSTNMIYFYAAVAVGIISWFVSVISTL